MLKFFFDSKQAEINRLAASKSLLFATQPRQRRSNIFSCALKEKVAREGIAIIAEYKRASPSAGNINLSVTPEEAALAYQQGGAAALSILTEETRFQGSLTYLKGAHSATKGMIPLLRKDFIRHSLQVEETARTPAAAFLLIVQLTPDASLLQDLRELGESYGLEAIVEVFNENDLDIARQSGAKLIQVNARDLHTFTMSRESALHLAQKERKALENELWIAASGIETGMDMKEAQKAGFDAVLVGTSLMKNANLTEALIQLRAEYVKK